MSQGQRPNHPIRPVGELGEGAGRRLDYIREYRRRMSQDPTWRKKRAEKQAAYHNAHPEVQAKRTADRRALLAEMKSSPCVDCHGSFPPECMDFDHIDPTEKTAPISELYLMSLERLVDEVQKCRLVCANCHRIRTAKQWRNGT